MPQGENPHERVELVGPKVDVVREAGGNLDDGTALHLEGEDAFVVAFALRDGQDAMTDRVGECCDAVEANRIPQAVQADAVQGFGEVRVICKLQFFVDTRNIE